ncbi:hypothetical protein IRJ41_021644, partial [Triplophysa rosa]
VVISLIIFSPTAFGLVEDLDDTAKIAQHHFFSTSLSTTARALTPRDN